jgi:Rps23 Pro-64 3,4-dihydroxylase Tpa1-like proline 4-hydroxylase
MTTYASLNFSHAEVLCEPFLHFVSTGAFGEHISLTLLSWLEREAPWRLVKTDFYEQFEFSLLDVQPPGPLSFLREERFLDDVRRKAEGMFRNDLGKRVDVTAHKLIPGQRIRLHNDFIVGQETHRLLVQLNRGWDDEAGGLLLFFNSPNPVDIYRVFRPVHNSVIGFAISPYSNHAVSTVQAGERFTLVFSFYGKSNDV